MQIDVEEFEKLRAHNGTFTVEQFPVTKGEFLDLELQRFSVTSESTRFVISGKDGDTIPLEFDASRITFLRGKVAGDPTSHVFMALSKDSSTGYIEQPGRRRSQIFGGPSIGPNKLVVFEPTATAAFPAVPLCDLKDSLEGTEAIRSPAAADTIAVRGMRQIELGVLTDYAYFDLFGNAIDAATYVVQLYGAVSDIYMRDVSARFDLAYVCIADTPESRCHEADQPYDAVQYLSGRQDDFGPGGAYLDALCRGREPQSWAAYIMGAFPSPQQPSSRHWDLYVTAHELGHNCGTLHTHQYSPRIDHCGSDYIPQRGTIMSYCNRVNGGMANYDFRFHARVQNRMGAYIENASCVVYDCNSNSVDDLLDIQSGNSVDSNANDIPDECEDCNGNGQLDTEDIASGAPDLNLNGLPDECEPDCNANNLPDDLDILSGASDDQNGNNIPDECEPDCNTNGIADHVEINTDMTLDIDRDAVLDECQDCDADGIGDLEALGGAHNLWAVTGPQQITEFNAAAGVRSGTIALAAADLLGSPNGHVLVASGARVAELDGHGNILGDFVTSGSGGLTEAGALAIGPSGNLFVLDQRHEEQKYVVLEFSGQDGTFVREFASSALSDELPALAMQFGPNGNLFVAGGNEVLEYDGHTGQFLRDFLHAASVRPDLAAGLVFKPDGNLLLSDTQTDRILEYDGQSGAFKGFFSVTAPLSGPTTLRIGPNGNVFVSNSDTTDFFTGNCRIYEIEASSGYWFRHAFVCGNDLNIGPVGAFDFVRGWELDCNLNFTPDNCDIASGVSLDENADGTPDECQIDCNANGTWDRLDIIPYGTSYDCNYNGMPDECELAEGLDEDCNGNSLLDQCEWIDCNENQVLDSCDIIESYSDDCDINGVPDECELHAWVEEAKLSASDSPRDAGFGLSIGLDGDVLVVGAPWDDGACPNDPGCDSGSVYVYRYNGSMWNLEQKFTPTDGARKHFFGRSISIDGSRIAVAAPSNFWAEDHTGSVYIYKYDGTRWALEQKLAGPEALEHTEFGCAVAMQDGTIVVGARLDDAPAFRSGSAYVYRYDQTGRRWQHEQQLSSGQGNEWFGTALAIDDQTIVVGAPGNDEAAGNAGVVYVFHHDGVIWLQQTKIVAADAETRDEFGSEVAVSGDTIVVGVRSDDDDTGSAYVYTYNPTNQSWELEQKLFAPDAPGRHLFGESVAIDGPTIALGASGIDQIYLYRHEASGQSWQLDHTAAAKGFGFSIAISRGIVAAGAVPNPFIDISAAYLFVRLDRDHDGFLNACDNCPLLSSENQSDTDGDGLGDNCDNCPGMPNGPDLGTCIWGRVGEICTPARGDRGCDLKMPGRNPPLVLMGVCDLAQADRDGDGVGDVCDNCVEHINPDQADCDGDGIGDVCEIAEGLSQDCNANSVPDRCEQGHDLDCNGNGEPDLCDIAALSWDCNENGVPDECEELEGWMHAYIDGEKVCLRRAPKPRPVPY